jgi:FSR family fosmidomycin resistance protein-like MFS transporter
VNYDAQGRIPPRISLIAAFIIHASVEIPFFIFPVILLLVGSDLFQDSSSIGWLGLGTIGTVGTLSAALPSPFFGKLADNHRRGVMMTFSLVLATIGTIIIGFWGQDFLIMLCGVVFLGLGVSLYHPPGLSWVTTAYEDPVTHSFSSKYNQVLALHGIGGGLGASLGPISVYFLLGPLNWQELYLFWTIPLVITTIVFWIFVGRFEPKNHRFVIEEKAEFVNNGKELIKKNIQSSHIVLIIIFAFMIAMSLNRGMIYFILSPFLSEVKGIEVTEAALFIGVSTLIGSTGQLLGGYFGDKYGEDVVLSFGAFFTVGILLIIYVVDSIPILFLAYIFHGIVNAIFWPSTNSLVAKNSRHKGQAFGLVMLIANLVGALGPILVGIIRVLEPGSYFPIFLFASLFSFLALLFLLYLRKIIPR